MGKKAISTLRLVIDTNVLVSAILFTGEASKILSLWQKKEITFLASKEVIEEYLKVFSYPKFNLSKEEIRYILEEQILPYVEPVQTKTEINLIKDDPADNKFLALAVDGKADCIISGDQHLLSLRRFHKTEIITIKEFLNRYSRIGR